MQIESQSGAPESPRFTVKRALEAETLGEDHPAANHSKRIQSQGPHYEEKKEEVRGMLEKPIQPSWGLVLHVASLCVRTLNVDLESSAPLNSRQSGISRNMAFRGGPYSENRTYRSI